MKRVQTRCLVFIGLPRDTVVLLALRRDIITRKEYKNILNSGIHHCKRFICEAVDHSYNLRMVRTVFQSHDRIRTGINYLSSWERQGIFN